MKTHVQGGTSPTSPALAPARVAFMKEYLCKALRETWAVHCASLLREMTARFEAVAKRFEAMDKRFNVVLWAIGLGFTATFALLTATIGFATRLVS